MARVTVEDCLKKVDNRFALVLLASQRAKQLIKGEKKPLLDKPKNKEAIIALREIAEGKVRIKTLRSGSKSR
jgi:DNA-directed RNA polymerase subunit omega